MGADVLPLPCIDERVTDPNPSSFGEPADGDGECVEGWREDQSAG